MPRDFGMGSIVCVCNSTYCDFKSDPDAPKAGEYIWYVSSKAGRRLDRVVGEMANEPLDGVTFTVDRTVRYQTIVGFGGAFTDAAGLNIMNMSLDTRENIIR